MKARDSALADTLLDAQVAFLLAQLQGEGLQASLQTTVTQLFADARQLKLNDLVDRKQVKGSLRRYAQGLQPTDAVGALLTDFARQAYASPAFADTTAGAVLSPQTVEAFVDHALTLQTLRERIVRACIESPLYARFASELLYNGIKDYLAQNALTESIPGARSMLKLGKAVMSRATPNLESSVEESLKRYIAKSIGGVSQRSVGPLIAAENNAFLRQSALELWAQVKMVPFGTLREYVDADELADFAALLWDESQTLRRTELFVQLLELGADLFFDHYGKRALVAVLQDFGIDQDFILREAMLHAPVLLRGLQRRRILERLLRQQLEPFYRSTAFAGVIKRWGAAESDGECGG